LWGQEADAVSVYDFPGDAECRAIPYGIYDVPHKRGHVSVGLHLFLASLLAG